MKCIFFNLYLLCCIGFQATAYAVHYISINIDGVDGILKSSICMFWIICCMISMVAVTKTYLIPNIEIIGNELLQFKAKNRLYSVLLSINTLFASLAFGSILLY